MSNRMMIWVAAALLAGINGCGLSPDPNLPPLEVADQVDVARYMGRWYEIAKYPVFFEQGCFGVTADYELQDDGTVRVLNTCRGADGGVASTIEGFAEVADAATNAKLTVYFFFPFGAPYWILEVGENYQYAVVGDPSRTFLWILSRTPTMNQQTFDDIVSRLPARAYDPEGLELTPQDSGTSP